MRFRSLGLAAALIGSSLIAQAWDYAGHRMVNLLALASLPADFPGFAKTSTARERIAFLAGEPDRWRNSTEPTLRHVNGPDHFMDLEWLKYADLTPESLTEFRYIYVEQLADARRAHPERFPPINPSKNKDETSQQSGFLPWIIVEDFAKLRSAFSYLKAYQESGTPEEVQNAQENAIYIMGVMGHYVGDGAQPLHLTENYNGWAEAENPHGYTTSKTIHAWIDGGFFQQTGGLSFDTLVQSIHPAELFNTQVPAGTRDPIFGETITYLVRQYAKMPALYELEKAGKLSPQNPREGRAFLDHQLIEAAEMLGSLWVTAWHDAPPDNYLQATLSRRKPKSLH